MKVVASAPGKAVILGEYAVLEDAPALVMAIDRRARVVLEPHEGPEFLVTAPGWNEESAAFRLASSGRVSFPEGVKRAEGYGLAVPIIEAFFRLRGGAAACAPFRLVLDSRALTEATSAGPRKLGLGSSAALTVALCRALGYHVASQQDGQPLALDDLVSIHSALQGRRGSGLDVAASLCGGVIEYRLDPSPRVYPARIPDGVKYCFVWCGHQTSTGAYLAALDTWRDRCGNEYQKIMTHLVEAAMIGVNSARDNDAMRFLQALDNFSCVLQDLGRMSDVDIVSEPHRRIRQLAVDCGVVYKPCGAGGGDVGIGLSQDPDSLAKFRARLITARLKPLSLKCDELGVQTQPEN